MPKRHFGLMITSPCLHFEGISSTSCTLASPPGWGLMLNTLELVISGIVAYVAHFGSRRIDAHVVLYCALLTFPCLSQIFAKGNVGPPRFLAPRAFPRRFIRDCSAGAAGHFGDHHRLSCSLLPDPPVTLFGSGAAITDVRIFATKGASFALLGPIVSPGALVPLPGMGACVFGAVPFGRLEPPCERITHCFD